MYFQYGQTTHRRDFLPDRLFRTQRHRQLIEVMFRLQRALLPNTAQFLQQGWAIQMAARLLVQLLGSMLETAASLLFWTGVHQGASQKGWPRLERALQALSTVLVHLSQLGDCPAARLDVLSLFHLK